MADRGGGNFLTIVARQYYEKLADGGEASGTARSSGVTNHRHQLALPTCLDTKDAEPVLVVVKGDPFDESGQNVV